MSNTIYFDSLYTNDIPMHLCPHPSYAVDHKNHKYALLSCDIEGTVAKASVVYSTQEPVFTRKASYSEYTMRAVKEYYIAIKEYSSTKLQDEYPSVTRVTLATTFESSEKALFLVYMSGVMFSLKERFPNAKINCESFITLKTT